MEFADSAQCEQQLYNKSGEMKEEESKRRRLISEQLKEKIKKKPYLQSIEGKQYLYSLLKKKNQSFFLTNERLLILIGNEALAYARNIPEHVHLPFYEKDAIPQFKAQKPLAQIINVTTNGESLLVEIEQEKSWEFVCDSKEVAEEWKQAILSAVRYMQIFQDNKAIAVELPSKEPIGDLQNNTLNHHFGHEVQPFLQNQSEPLGNNVLKNGQIRQPAAQKQSQVPNLPPQMSHFAQSEKKDKHAGNYESQLKLQPSKKSNMALNRTIDFQAEYHLKKKEEQEKKQQLSNLEQMRPASMRASIEVLTELHWDFEFAKSENQYLIIQKFKNHVETVATTLIDQLSLADGQRQILPIEDNSVSKKYKVGDITLEIYSFQLEEIQHFEEKVTVVNAEESKRAQRQFKNANYIVQVTRNKGRFRVPLMVVLEYKGFVVAARANVHSTNQYAALAETLEWDVSEFERQTRIERGVFEEESNVKVLAADQAWFDSMNSGQTKFRRFDICFLTEIRNFLPRDLHMIGKDGTTSKCLRAELLEDEQYEDLLLTGDDVSQTINRLNVSSQKRKAVALLADIGQSIPQKLKELAEKLSNLDEIFTNSAELSAIMHFHGLNMRYLGQLFNSISLEWLRSLLMSQIVARSAKYFLKHELQESSLSLKASTVEESFELQATQVIGWLNRIFGVGRESEGVWLQIARQAAIKYKANIQKETLNVGYFIQALQHSGAFKLNLEYKPRPYFKTANVFFRSDFQEFTVKSKVFDPAFTQHYQTLQTKLQDFSFPNYEYVATLLNIQNRQAIDSHYGLSDMHEQITTFLSNWLSPSKASFLYDSGFHSRPSKSFYGLQLTAIKWHLKVGQQQVPKAEQLRDRLIQHIDYWLGESHPLLSPLYDIFARYYVSIKQQKQAVSFCRTSLKNQEKLLGSNHFKLADAYYGLADIQLHYHKRKEALGSFKRAFQIIEENGRGTSLACVEISNHMAQLYLEAGLVEESLRLAKRSLAVAEQMNFKLGFLEAAELIGRCYQYEQNWQEYSTFAVYLSPLVELFSESTHQLMRVTKLILMPAFRFLAVRSRVAAGKLLAIFAGFLPRDSDWQQGFQYLKLKIAEKSFPGFILECIDTGERMINEVEVSGAASRWRGIQQISNKLGRESHQEQFLGELECLKWLLSGCFVEGVLESEL